MISDKGAIAEFRTDLCNIFSGSFVEKVKSIPDEILHTDETELIKHFNPVVKDFLLRKKLTQLVREHKNSGSTDTIETSRIYEGIMMHQNFYGHYAKNPYRLAWIITPLDTYEDIVEDAAYHGMMRMRKAMMTMELTEKTLAAFAKMVEFFNIRAKGVPIQRVQQTNTNVSLDGNKAIKDVLDASQVEDKIKELKAKAISLPADAVIVDEPE